MVRLTTDNPTDNIEASLNLFYVRDGDAFIRGGGDAPDYADISVTDFIRKAARALCPDMLLPESAEEISFAMAERENRKRTFGGRLFDLAHGGADVCRSGGARGGSTMQARR